MLIKNKLVGSKGMFFGEVNGNILAELVYTLNTSDRMIIEHTEVSEDLKGQNVGCQLVNTAVDYARKHKLKITPLCPFANSIFEKQPAYRDVLYKYS